MIMTDILDPLMVHGTAQSTTQGIFMGTCDEMPEASEDRVGVVVYYRGPAQGAYRPHSLYLCATHDDGATWVWEPLVVSLADAVAKANVSVPSTRRVNGKPLTDDVWFNASDVGAMPDTVRIPTKVSELSNDGVFITQDVCTLSNYWTKGQTKKVLEPYCHLYVVDAFPEDDAIDPHALYSVPQNGARHLFYRVDGQWVQVA